MKKSKFNKSYIWILSLVFILGAIFVMSVGAAEESEKIPEISSQNIRFSDKLSLMYAVDASTVTSGKDVTLTVYSDKELSERVYTETIPYGKINNADYGYPKEAYIFVTKSIAYHQMAANYYVQVTVGDKTSDAKRYSAAEYFYERLAAEGDKKPTDTQKNFYNSALKFGANAEIYTGVKTADAEDLITKLRYVTVEEGTVDGGFKTGLYPIGKLVTFTPDEGIKNTNWTMASFGEEGVTTAKRLGNTCAFTVSDCQKTLITPNDADNYRANSLDDYAAGAIKDSQIKIWAANYTEAEFKTASEAEHGTVIYAKMPNVGSSDLIFYPFAGYEYKEGVSTTFEASFDIKMTPGTAASERHEFQIRGVSGVTHNIHRTSFFAVKDGLTDNFYLQNAASGSSSGAKSFDGVSTTGWIHVRVVMYDGDDKCYVYVNDDPEPMINTAIYSSTYEKLSDIKAFNIRNCAVADEEIYIDNVFIGFTEDEKFELNNEEAIEKYKDLAASFDTADFGAFTAGDSNNQFSLFNNSPDGYGTPAVYPTSGSHPRVLFTDTSIETVRANLDEAIENSNAKAKYLALSDISCDGKFKTVSGELPNNWDESIASQIEAKAFRYAMTGEKLYGYQAIYALKNAILTINVSDKIADSCRTYGYLMYVAGCVYDWCYDLLTEADKTQLINGCVIKLGKHLEIVRYSGIGGDQIPTKQGALYDHGAEDQLLVDYLSFAIACYDEAPEIYELVAGRILNVYVPAQNYLYKSGSHSEGAMYGFVRGASTLVSNLLFNKMTDGTATPFEHMEKVMETGTHYIRPDGQMYRIGDLNENRTELQSMWFANCCFYAGNLYENDYLKSYAYEYLDNFNSFTSSVSGLSAVQFLAVNDTSVGYTGTGPLINTTTYPHTSIFAKSANDDENAFGIYMTMPENNTASHAHMELGSFQIFYKGALASDSGAYTTWGDAHHMGYAMQTISSNSLIIYNPSLADTVNETRETMIYSGGQSIAKSGELPKTLEELLSHDRLNQCTSLGVVNKEENGKYLYSYMGGDMTAAYDEETVNEVTRYMLAVATGDTECPLVFLTFDRIESKDKDFHKAALIHVQQEPTITDNGFAIITNGEGRMVVQSVGDATEYVKWGGEGKEFWIPGVGTDGKYSLENGQNLPIDKTLVEGSIAEYGWGRIEISPETAAEKNHMLTVMYVTDASNNATVKAEDISSENLAGTMIFGKAMLFSKNEKLLTEESTFTINSGADCFVAGVSAGTWNVTCGTETQTVTVEDGENLLTFTAGAAGTYTIAPVVTTAEN